MKLRSRIFAGVGLLAVAAVGWFGVRTWHVHQVIAARIPDPPDVSTWPPELQDRIQEADQRARRWLRPLPALAELSRLYQANAFFDEALACDQALEVCEPGDARWFHLHANILAGLGQPDEAAPLFRRAAALAPDYAPAQVRLGDALLKAGHTNQAVQVYGQVVARHGDHPYALLGLARCAVANNDWTKARAYLQRALAVSPEFIGALSLMVTVHEHAGEQGEADAIKLQIGRREFSDLADPWLDALREDCYDAYRLSVAAVVTNMAGDPATAMHLLQRAVALAPNTGSYHRQLGLMLSHVPDYPAAREQLEQAVRLTPTDRDAWLLLYQLLTSMGEKDTAGRTLAAGLANCPESASLHLEQARRLNTAGMREEAINEFRESYRLQPSEAGPLVEMASVLFTVNRSDEALAALHTALEKQPEHPLALATLMFDAISKGDERGALAWWDHVRRQPRTPPHTVTSLRDAYRQHFGRDLP